jgi:hypothetical protein
LSIDNFGLRVIVKQLKELDEDINEYLNTKAFIKYKSHLSFLRIIEPSLILSIVMSKAIPFVVKYENNEDQPVTKLFLKTGEALFSEVVHKIYTDSNSCKIKKSKEYTVKNFMVDNNLILSEEELVSLGCDFITFFSERSNFIEVKDIMVRKDLRKRVIIPKSDLISLLENVTYLDTEELPMIIKPYP